MRNDPAEREKLLKKKEKILNYEDGVKFAKKIKAIKYVNKLIFIFVQSMLELDDKIGLLCSFTTFSRPDPPRHL